MSRRKEPAIPSDLLDQLLAGGDAAAALQQGGLLDSLKKALAERVLNAEMDHHLGHEEQAGNSRNGYSRKTVATDTGKIELEVPRDRQGSFDPQPIAPGPSLVLRQQHVESLLKRSRAVCDLIASNRPLYLSDLSRFPNRRVIPPGWKTL
jgi:hypothetical protein